MAAPICTPHADRRGSGVDEEGQSSHGFVAHQVKAVAAQPQDGVQQQANRGEFYPCQRLPPAMAAHIGLYLLRRPRRDFKYVYVLAGTGQAPALRFAALEKRRQPRVRVRHHAVTPAAALPEQRIRPVHRR